MCNTTWRPLARPCPPLLQMRIILIATAAAQKELPGISMILAHKFHRLLNVRNIMKVFNACQTFFSCQNAKVPRCQAPRCARFQNNRYTAYKNKRVSHDTAGGCPSFRQPCPSLKVHDRALVLQPNLEEATLPESPEWCHHQPAEQQCPAVVALVDILLVNDQADVKGVQLWEWFSQASGCFCHIQGKPVPSPFLWDRLFLQNASATVIEPSVVRPNSMPKGWRMISLTLMALIGEMVMKHLLPASPRNHMSSILVCPVGPREDHLPTIWVSWPKTYLDVTVRFASFQIHGRSGISKIGLCPASLILKAAFFSPRKLRSVVCSRLRLRSMNMSIYIYNIDMYTLCVCRYDV